MAHLFLSTSSAGLTFLFSCLVLLDGNEVGAKVFYIIVSSAIYGITPGEIKALPQQQCCIDCTILRSTKKPQQCGPWRHVSWNSFYYPQLAQQLITTSNCCRFLGFLSLYPPEIMRVFGPQHTATISGMIYSAGVSGPIQFGYRI